MDMFEVAKKVVGLTKREAIDLIKKTDGNYRFVRDGNKDLPIIDDLKDDRISMEMESGLVVKAYVF